MTMKALEHYLSPLLPFIEREGVTEICINKPQHLFVEQKGVFTHHVVETLTYPFLETLALLIAEFNQKEFPAPLISGALPRGERVQFVMRPACENNRIICSIRKHHLRELTLQHYAEQGAFDDIQKLKKNTGAPYDEELKALYHKKDVLGFLTLAISAKKNIIFCGGTGTGKTTFLNTCLKVISPHERLITLEDTREIRLTQPNVVHLLYQDDDPSITPLKLFKTALRLRPDRIFLSELRGEEAWAFLRAANSGHPGSLSTVHADTTEACFDQLVFMVQQAGGHAEPDRIKTYIKSIINIVIPLQKSVDPKRYMTISDLYFDVIEKEKRK